MNAKAIFVSLMLIFIAEISSAQDSIYKKSGEIIEAKVSAINTEVIIFKKFTNPDGPEYSIPKADVIKIKYANGTEDVFGDEDDRIGIKSKEMPAGGKGRMLEKIKANNNILSIAPLEVTENGFGVGATWEHNIDKAGWVSFYLPVVATFNAATTRFDGTPSYDPLFYFMPGIKVYTNLNSPRRAKFSINPSLVAAVGRHTNTVYDNSGGGIPYTTENQQRFLLGGLVNFGMNYFTSNRLYLGIDYGIGVTYLNNYDGVNSGFTTLQQFSFRVGYRYRTGRKIRPVQQ